MCESVTHVSDHCLLPVQLSTSGEQTSDNIKLVTYNELDRWQASKTLQAKQVIHPLPPKTVFRSCASATPTTCSPTTDLLQAVLPRLRRYVSSTSVSFRGFQKYRASRSEASFHEYVLFSWRKRRACVPDIQHPQGAFLDSVSCMFVHARPDSSDSGPHKDTQTAWPRNVHDGDVATMLRSKKRRRPINSSPEQTPAHEASSQSKSSNTLVPNGDNLESMRRHLLMQSDWVGVKVRTCIFLSFAICSVKAVNPGRRFDYMPCLLSYYSLWSLSI